MSNTVSSTLTLTPIGGEPRIHDLQLAEHLGFERPVKIRDMIKRNEAKLLKFGILPTVGKIHEAAGRPTAEYFLNQKQAIFVCMKSETEKAFDVQIEIVRVFDAYLNGEMKCAPPVLPPTAPELVSATDMQNLTRLVWLTTHWFRQQGSFVRAVWKAMRSATGVPAPQRFQVQHIPLLAAEIRRIHLITRALADLIAEAERTAICRILNRGERTEKVLLDIKNALAQANAADLQGVNAQLGKWDEQELDAFLNRMPTKTAVYPEFAEPWNASMGWEG
jgi:hypothetical protein